MINIVIPSYKRHNNLVGKDYFTMAKYVVPESQKEDYEKVVGKERVIAIPDECDGSITKKRNWILNNIPRPLVMIDDDVDKMYYFDKRQENYVQRVLDKNLFMDFVEQGFELAKGFDVKMWGVAQNYDPRVYRDNKPFSLRNAILGPFQAHLEHDLVFDYRMGTKEDYDMSLQQLRKYKKVLRLEKFAYSGIQQENEGGIVSYRTMEKEIDWCKNIMKKWGKGVIRYTIPPKAMTDLRNGRVESPIKGV